MLNDAHKKILIGVAWPYVNGDLHIGNFIGSFLPADIMARFHRLQGKEVLMVSGSDCFGTPTTIEADKRKITPKQVEEEYHPQRLSVIEKFGISFDLYTKTDTLNHKKISQDFFIKLLEKGYIFKGTSNQYFSETEKRFLPDRYVEGICPNCKKDGARSDQCENCGAVIQQGELINPLSKNTKTAVELRETEHYFLDWPKLQPFLESYIEKVTDYRDWVLKETKGWLKTGLKPREITRDLDWGVELPVERIPESERIKNIQNKRIYVWFEAVIGYFSASLEWAELTDNDWKKFWYGSDVYHYYFMGKDNLIFHTLFWPGQLHVYDENLKLPDNVVISQFLNLEGQKFSKSRGLIVDPIHLAEKFGVDPVRFYLTLIMPENSDSNFSFDDFYEKVNNVLIGNYGNFVNRVLTLSKGVDFSNSKNDEMFDEVRSKVESVFLSCAEDMNSAKFKDYLNGALSLSSFANSFMSEKEPWKLKENKSEFEKVLKNLIYLVIGISQLLTPVIPATTKKVFEMLSISEQGSIDELIKQVKISGISPLFTKIEMEQIEEEKKSLPI